MRIKTRKFKDIAFNLLDPMIRRRTGLSFEVIENWSMIVGADIALLCSPIKLKWPYMPAGNKGYKPATLLIAAAGGLSVQIMHQNLQIIDRINSFFGYYAVDKIKITQQAVISNMALSVEDTSNSGAGDQLLTEQDEQLLSSLVKNIQDESLKASLLKMGRSIYKDITAKKVS